LIPVVAVPFTRYFCPNKKSKKIGANDTTELTNKAPQELSAVKSTNLAEMIFCGQSLHDN
jgi:hypothetical protein